MVRSPEWRALLDRYRWLDRYLAGDAFARFVTEEEARVRSILRQLGTGEGDGGSSSAGVYPLFVLAGLLACGLASIVRSPAASAAASSAPARQDGTSRPMWLIASGIALNVLFAERLGFVPASAALFWLTARAFDPRHPLRDGLFAVGVSLAAYLLFARMLQLQLPAGVLAGWI
jgi:hypothetical protein